MNVVLSSYYDLLLNLDVPSGELFSRLKQNLDSNTQEGFARGTICRASLNDGSKAGVLREAQVDYPMGGMIQLNNEPFYNTYLDI